MVYFCTGHFKFSQFPGVAQSCKLGNQGQFVLGPHWNTNLQKNFIGKELGLPNEMAAPIYKGELLLINGSSYLQMGSPTYK